MDEMARDLIVDMNSPHSLHDYLNLEAFPPYSGIEEPLGYLSDDCFQLVNTRKKLKDKQKIKVPSMITRSKS